MAARRKNADLWRCGIVAYTIDGDVARLDLINEAISTHRMSILPGPAATIDPDQMQGNLQAIQQRMPTTRPWPG